MLLCQNSLPYLCNSSNLLVYSGCCGAFAEGGRGCGWKKSVASINFIRRQANRVAHQVAPSFSEEEGTFFLLFNEVYFFLKKNGCVNEWLKISLI